MVQPVLARKQVKYRIPLMSARDAYSRLEALQDTLSVLPYGDDARPQLLHDILAAKKTYTIAYLFEASFAGATA